MATRIATMEDIHALEAIPLAQRCLPDSTYQVIVRAAERSPDSPALAFFETPETFDRPAVYSYAALCAEVTRTANLFHRLGIRSGKAVSYMLPALPQTHFVLWGAQAAGIVNPVNPMLEPSHIADILTAAGTEVLVVPAPTADGGEVWRKAVAVARLVPGLRHILTVDPTGAGVMPPPDGLPPGLTVADFDAERSGEPADRLVGARVFASSDIAACFHTGGTTGIPKLAQHTHGNEVFDAWLFGFMLDLPATASIICGLPMFHVNAAIITGMAPFLRGQCAVLACPAGYRTPGLLDRFWKIAAHYGIGAFSAVPTLLGALLERPVDADITSLRYVMCGAAPLPVEVQKRFEAATGITILEGYGLTEATCGSTMNPRDGERRVGSVGFRFPYQGMMAAVLDDRGRFVRACADDEVGHLLLHGPNVFPGYRQEQHNAGVWVAVDGVDWLNTGDMGRRDADGYFWLTGRKKELIIRGGHNIDPRVIEEALHRHPAVRLSAAVGRLDAYAGELPVAYVELAPGATASEAELLAFAAGHIGERAAVPKAVTILDKLPVTPVGKLYKPVLREREAAAVCHAALQGIAGCEDAETTGHTDSRRGLVVRVTLGGGPDARPRLEQAIGAALGHFAIHHEIVWRG